MYKCVINDIWEGFDRLFTCTTTTVTHLPLTWQSESEMSCWESFIDVRV